MRIHQHTLFLPAICMTAFSRQEPFLRDIVFTGGFALRNTTCDINHSDCLTTIADFEVCCPSSLTCIGGSNDRCCPTGPSVHPKRGRNTNRRANTNAYNGQVVTVFQYCKVVPRCALIGLILSPVHTDLLLVRGHVLDPLWRIFRLLLLLYWNDLLWNPCERCWCCGLFVSR